MASTLGFYRKGQEIRHISSLDSQFVEIYRGQRVKKKAVVVSLNKYDSYAEWVFNRSIFSIVKIIMMFVSFFHLISIG